MEIVRNIDIGFTLNYIGIPVLLGFGIVSGRKSKNHIRLATASAFKGMFYFYCAVANIFNYINNNWELRHVAGLTIALAIIEGFNGMFDCVEEFRKDAIEKTKY